MHSSTAPCPPCLVKAKKRKAPKLGPPLPAPHSSGRLLLRLLPAKVGMLRFLLEGYDNIAYFTVLERQTALLKLVFSPHREKATREALRQIASSLALEVQEWPCPSPATEDCQPGQEKLG